jgi:hypothetical protein
VAFALNMVAVAVLFQPGFPLGRWVTAIGIDVLTGVVPIKNSLEVLAVMHFGGVTLKTPDHLVLGIDVD